jgi:transcription initiation factor TFIID subunit 9B
MAEVNGDVPQTNGHTSPSTQPAPSTSQSQPTTTSTATAPQPAMPATSLSDTGLSKRPRDARLVHLLLSSLGCTAYQERVPLQLLDFAYRHSSSILSDALHLSSDAYVSQQTRARDAPPGGSLKDADGQVSMAAVKLAIESRLQYQFAGGSTGGLSKEFLLEVANDRNKVGLPRVVQNDWGVRLPSERFVMNGVSWGLKDGVWEEEGEESEEETQQTDVTMGGGDGAADEEDGIEGNEDGGKMEDLFGAEAEDADNDIEME